MKDNKIIEEMAETVYENVYLEGHFTKGTSKAIARFIIEQGYRKLPKDSVVLSREEFEKYKIIEYLGKESKSTTIPAHKLFKTFREIEEKASKETAEKFYKKVRKLLKKVDIIVDGDEGLVGYEESAVDKGLTELAKQFGVEIGE